MKKKLWSASWLLGLVLMLALLVGCGSKGPNVTVGEAKLSDFAVTYGGNALWQLDGVEYQVAADHFAELAKERLGMTMEVMSFNAAKEKGCAYTIVFGNAGDEVTKDYFEGYVSNRRLGPADKDFYISDEFQVICKDGKTIYFLGEGPRMMIAGVDWFFDTYLAEKLTSDEKNASVETDLAYTGTYHRYTVACIGDSITYGYGASNQAYYSYPAQMQKKLGIEYHVINFGVSGKTLSNLHDDAYIKTMDYKKLQECGSYLDMAVIMLGTNDGNRFARSWSDAVVKDLTDSFNSLVDVLRQGNPNIKIFYMNAPMSYREGNWDYYITRNILPLMDTVTADAGIPLFDMHTYTYENLEMTDFPDLLHPSDKGYGVIAGKVAELVHEYEK